MVTSTYLKIIPIFQTGCQRRHDAACKAAPAALTDGPARQLVTQPGAAS